MIDGDGAYIPLEMLDLGLEKSQKDLVKVDVFSFGLTLLQMMTGIEVPQSSSDWYLLRKSGQASKLLEGFDFSDRLKSLVCRCISPKPSERPTPTQILGELIAF